MGKITIYDDFYSPLDKFKRTVRVYTPDSYEENKDKKYPVIYMTDGQNVFEHPRSARRDTWRVNETLDAMWAEGTLQREWIVCAIDHEIDRFGEYTPWYYPAASVYDPKGRKFLNNLTEFFIPWMNARYRTLEGPQNTALMGSSLGGLISLFCGRERPDVFGRIGAVSPSVMWADYRTFEHWNSKQEFWTKIYIDMGSEERIMVQDIFMDYAAVVGDFYRHLLSIGYAEHEVYFYVDPGGVHSEQCWAGRFSHIAKTLLNDD
jgi:predicted alpha/beta superfamily hydrolase